MMCLTASASHTGHGMDFKCKPPRLTCFRTLRAQLQNHWNNGNERNTTHLSLPFLLLPYRFWFRRKNRMKVGRGPALSAISLIGRLVSVIACGYRWYNRGGDVGRTLCE